MRAIACPVCGETIPATAHCCRFCNAVIVDKDRAGAFEQRRRDLLPIILTLSTFAALCGVGAYVVLRKASPERQADDLRIQAEEARKKGDAEAKNLSTQAKEAAAKGDADALIQRANEARAVAKAKSDALTIQAQQIEADAKAARAAKKPSCATALFGTWKSAVLTSSANERLQLKETHQFSFDSWITENANEKRTRQIILRGFEGTVLYFDIDLGVVQREYSKRQVDERYRVKFSNEFKSADIEFIGDSAMAVSDYERLKLPKQICAIDLQEWDVTAAEDSIPRWRKAILYQSARSELIRQVHNGKVERHELNASYLNDTPVVLSAEVMKTLNLSNDDLAAECEALKGSDWYRTLKQQ